MFSSLIRDLYDPYEYRYNVVPRLLLEDYTPSHSHSHPHIHFNVIRPRRQQSSQNDAEDSNKFQVSYPFQTNQNSLTISENKPA